MPSKDILKRRKTVYDTLKRRQIQYGAIKPLILLMKLMKVGESTPVTVISIPELKLETIWLGDEENVIASLEVNRFPYKVQAWNKRFSLICTEMVEGEDKDV